MPRDLCLHIQQLTLARDGQAPIATDWSATIEPGLVLLHGDTGSGKTSLLRVLAGQAEARGHIALGDNSASADAAAYKSQVFYVDPWDDRFDQMKPRECAESLSQGRGLDDTRWNASVESFSLTPHLEKSLFMLSTGTKRKVFLAAALACSLPLVLLDEPAAALDAASTQALWRALGAMAATPSRIVVVASSDVPADVPFSQRLELPLGAV